MNIIRIKDFKHKNALSASRIDTFLECSAKYAFKYLYKCPDTPNDGAARGSVAHDTFEILADKKYEDDVNSIIEAGTVTTNDIWKKVVKLAKEYNVSDSENLKLIDSFIVTGLKQEFYGDRNTVEILTEKEFDFEYEDGSISYRIKGYIDSVLISKDDNGLFVKIRDYKSSKAKFSEDKINNNHQTFIYQLAITRFLFPNLEFRSFDFVFLKFTDDPIQPATLLSPEAMRGYEIWLSDIQKQVDNFDESNVGDRYAANDFNLKRMRCGKEGIKRDGTPNFIAPCQRPFDYYVLLEGDSVKQSSMTNNFKVEDGQRVEKRRYQGCSYFFKNGERIRT